MNQTSTATTIQGNALSQAVGKWLMGKGFVLADCIGEALNILDLGRLDVSLEPDHIGIILNNPKEIQKISWLNIILVKLFGKTQRREFLGVLWFDNTAREATNTKWIFDLYYSKKSSMFGKRLGRIILAKTLALNLSIHFGVGIDVRMIDQPCFEKI